MPLPALRQQPSARRRERSVACAPLQRSRCGRRFPTLEPFSGGAGVQAHRFRNVLAPIHDHVNQTTPHLARCSQCSRVKSVAPKSAAPPENTVEGTRHTSREPGHSTREADLVPCFDQQMHVIRLHREVHDAKPRKPRLHQRPSNLCERNLPAQTGESACGAQSHVHGMAFLVVGASAVRNPARAPFGFRPAPLRLPPHVGPNGSCSWRMLT